MNMREAFEIAKMFGLDDEQTNRFIERIENEGKYVEKEKAPAIVRTWAMQIKNERGPLLDTGRKRIIEELIALRDAEGLSIFVPGLSIEKAREYIEADDKDYQERIRRIQMAVEGDNNDLDIAHSERMRQLISGNFDAPKMGM